jgi:hypothetical protein
LLAIFIWLPCPSIKTTANEKCLLMIQAWKNKKRFWERMILKALRVMMSETMINQRKG